MKSSEHQAWLDERRTGIGGSDVSAILGLSQWATPYSVWADKLGKLPEREDNEAMRLGRDLESYVADRFIEKTGKKVRRINKILRHKEFPFMIANIDRAIIGEKAGFEAKTTSILNIKNFKDGEFPVIFYAQCTHYLAVTGYDRWYLAVLVFNQGFYIYQITRIEDDIVPDWCESSVYVDDDEISALINAEREFWNYVMNNIPPPVDGLEPTSDTLKTIYKESHETSVELFGRDKIFDELMELKEQEELMKIRKEELKQIIMSDLGESEKGAVGDYIATWKSQGRATFDNKQFFKDNPELIEKAKNYWKISSSRVFRFKKEKEQ